MLVSQTPSGETKQLYELQIYGLVASGLEHNLFPKLLAKKIAVARQEGLLKYLLAPNKIRYLIETCSPRNGGNSTCKFLQWRPFNKMQLWYMVKLHLLMIVVQLTGIRFCSYVFVKYTLMSYSSMLGTPAFVARHIGNLIFFVALLYVDCTKSSYNQLSIKYRRRPLRNPALSSSLSPLPLSTVLGIRHQVLQIVRLV